MSEVIGGNAQGHLRSICERIENVEQRRKQCSEDRKLIMAEAKSSGFKPKLISYLIRERAKKPEQRAEEQSLIATYEHGVGLADEPPLFRQLQAMASDASSEDKLLEAFKKLAPQKGDFIVRVGTKPMRIWRDKDGNPQSEPWVERPIEPKGSAAPLPPRQQVEAPDVDEQGAYELGVQYARDNRPVIDNPFPFGDKRRPKFDEGWRHGAGNDGMGA
jgi:uncharacterized protein (UPF0335 family)